MSQIQVFNPPCVISSHVYLPLKDFQFPVFHMFCMTPETTSDLKKFTNTSNETAFKGEEDESKLRIKEERYSLGKTPYRSIAANY